MSRCFPFPPPGYVANGLRDEAMIESSIKGAEEKCCKEERKKERKRDKKEKKEKKKERGEGEREKHSHKRRRKEEVAKDVQNNQKVDVFRKLKESENDCVEKSSLTVERELVQSTSCDSTLNSNEKEKKQPPLNGSRHNNNNSNEQPKEEKEKQTLDDRHNNNNNNDSESIIRIRLPIRRPKDDLELMMTTNKDQQCPSQDLKLDSVVTREQPQPPCSSSAALSKPHKEKRKHHTSTRKHRETYQPSTSLCRFCPPSMAEQFLNVVENWVPSTIEMPTNSEEDECWWLMKKKPSSHTERCKQLGRNNETKQVIITTSSSLLTWPPRARLLPEADVYALPYTVPF